MVEISHPIRSFQAFWPFYVGEHRKPLCRVLHYIGTGTFLASAISFLLSGSWSHLGIGVLCGYGFAWIGHFRVEGNRPATFRYPLLSLLADWKMLFYFVTGRMEREMVRLYGSVDPAPEAPLLQPR